MGKKFSVITVYIIGLVDLFIGLLLICIASFQFAKGASLMTGLGQKSDNEKLTRLAAYGMIMYIFLLIQLGMGIRLFRSASKIVERPVYAIKVLKYWREWSVIYVMAILLHAIVVYILMENGQRRFICLICSLPHAIIRPIGIILIGKLKKDLENHLPTKF